MMKAENSYSMSAKIAHDSNNLIALSEVVTDPDPVVAKSLRRDDDHEED
jgi:hypothetical protein